MMGRGGAFKGKKQTSAVADELRSAISGDSTISDITKRELLTELGGGKRVGIGAFNKISSTFEKAREGIDPKFKARQLQKAKKTQLSNQPGRRQTVLTR